MTSSCTNSTTLPSGSVARNADAAASPAFGAARGDAARVEVRLERRQVGRRKRDVRQPVVHIGRQPWLEHDRLAPVHAHEQRRAGDARLNDRIAEQLAVEPLRGVHVADLEGDVVQAHDRRARGRLGRDRTHQARAHNNRMRVSNGYLLVRNASRSAISAGETTLSRSVGIDDCGSIAIVLMSPRGDQDRLAGLTQRHGGRRLLRQRPGIGAPVGAFDEIGLVALRDRLVRREHVHQQRQRRTMPDAGQVGAQVAGRAVADLVTRRARLRKHRPAAPGVAAALHRGGVAVDDRGPRLGAIFEQRARRRAQLRIAMHDELALLPEVHRPARDRRRCAARSTSRRSRAGSASSSSMAPERARRRQRRPDAQDEPADRLARHRRQRRQRGHLHRLGLARIDPRLKLRLARRDAAKRRQADRVGASGRIGRRVGGQGHRLGHGSRRVGAVAQLRDAEQAKRRAAHAAVGPLGQREQIGAAAVEQAGACAAHPATHALERRRLPPRVVCAAARHRRNQAGHATGFARGGDGRSGQREKRRMPVGLPCARDAVGRQRRLQVRRGAVRVRPTAPPPASTGRRDARRTTVPARLSTRPSRARPASPATGTARARPVRRRRGRGRRPEASQTRPGAARPAATRSPARRLRCPQAPARRTRSSSRPRPSSVHSACRRPRGDAPWRATRLEQRPDLRRPAIEQQALRRATPPQIVVRQRVDQRRVGRRAQARRRGRLGRSRRARSGRCARDRGQG